MSLLRQIGKAIRETGQALNVLGVVAEDKVHHLDHFSRHRKVMPLDGKVPTLGDRAWVAPSASVVGDVSLAQGTSVWYGAVVRADDGEVTVGADSNVQDDAVVGGRGTTAIGRGVTIGHGAIILNSHVGDGCLIGIRAVLNGAKVAPGSLIAAGAVLGPGSEVATGQLWSGNPASFKRDLTVEEKAFLGKSAQEYSQLAGVHAREEATAL